MATSNKLIGHEWNDLPLFAGDTLVSLSVQQVIAKVKKILATCGLGYDKPLANYDPGTQSWRMSAGIFPWGEQPSLPILPPSGMTRNGELCQQPAWEPLTGATAFSSWPTPTASDWKGRGPNSQQQGLPEAVKRSVRYWPTPRAALGDARNHTVYARSTDKPQNLENKVGTADPSAVGGKLNPTWVEWLMGFPPGWTDLED
jgi:hypothetical protein